jgi:hypothetical protein
MMRTIKKTQVVLSCFFSLAFFAFAASKMQGENNEIGEQDNLTTSDIAVIDVDVQKNFDTRLD